MTNLFKKKTSGASSLFKKGTSAAASFFKKGGTLEKGVNTVARGGNSAADFVAFERAGTKPRIERAKWHKTRAPILRYLILYQIFKINQLGKGTSLRLGKGIPP